MTSLRRSVVALAVLIAAAASTPSPASAAPAQPTIVLVHGAWADASGFTAEIRALQRRGFPVIAPANPLRGLTSDAAYVRSVLQTISGPVVLVGHSYGGAVITGAATGVPNVKSLVYLAAFVPDEGETVNDLNARNPGSLVGPDTLVARPYSDGTSQGTDLYLTKAGYLAGFAGDLPRRVAAAMWAQQRPLAVTASGEPSGAPAWKTLPSRYLIATRDKTIPPATQTFMATRAGAKVTRVRSSHAIMVSHPGAVTKAILAAAR